MTSASGSMENIINMPMQDVAWDISHLQRQLYERLHELQNNTDALRATQRELLETRHALYSTELLLEKERGISHELTMQLRTAVEAAGELRQQRAADQLESVQLQVKYDAMAKRHDCLTNEITTAKVRETESGIKIQSLEEELRQGDTTNAGLERALNELERDSSRAIDAIDHNVTRLKQEHQRLAKSCETINSLNQRLQIVGLCAHAIHQKDKKKIEDLECTLASMSIKNVKHDDVHPQTEKLKATCGDNGTGSD